MLDRVNQRSWDSRDGIRSLISDEDLQPPEAHIFQQLLADELRGARILELGVGTGRVTKHLLELTPNFVGIDYAPNMVAICKERFPDTEFHTADVRDLSAFRDDEFDFVVFSYNGLDYISNEDRLTALNEIWLVLKPGGRFVFSTHNLGATKIPGPWSLGNIEFTPNPILLAKRCYSYARGIFNHLKNRRHQVEGDGYQIRNDAVNYTILTYYISPEAQLAQLEDFNFGDARLFDLDGAEPRVGEATDTPWIYYLTTKL